MHLAKLTTIKYLSVLLITCSLQFTAFSQENSPYSRYGLGDLTPNHNIISRGMGGIAAGYASFQSINFINPASYSYLSYLSYTRNLRLPTIFDIGAEADVKTLKSISPPDKFSATNLAISYLQLGLPVRMKKANKKGIFLGVNLGIKPVSKINYKSIKHERIAGVDSLVNTFEGSGGVNETYAGAGIRIKNFSIGFNIGYLFGNKDISSKKTFLNDSVSYYQSNSTSKTTFGGVFFNAGVQYETVINKKGILRVGAYGSLKNAMDASQDIRDETVIYDAAGAQYRVDSVYGKNKVKGKVVYPATYGIGFTYQDSAHWMFGADFEGSNWTNYRFYDSPDSVQNNWKIRAGAEYYPNKPTGKKYFNFVHYRAGFYYGHDYIRLNNNQLPEYGFTFGAGFPLKLRRSFYETQSSLLNAAFEIGSRGNKKSNVRENIFRISIGLALSDIWFSRAKYD